MNAERLLAHYERIANAPDAIPRLRRFVLDLAVRGKLVPQDPNDEPASEFLKRIAAEKARLVKAGEIGREKSLPPLSETDRSFALPLGWAWVRLGELSKLVTSGSRDWAKHYSSEGAIFVRMGNLSKDHYRLRLDHIQRVRPPAHGEGTRTRLEAGDILISITGDVGMLGLIPDGFGEAYINQHTAMARPMPQMKGRYLAELFRSPFAQDQFNEPQRGIKNSFRLSDVTQFVVPLPPLAEQHRIVAKVDELMALCDRLKASRAGREATRDRLTAASLARLNTPDPDPATFADNARFALNNLAALTTRPDQIKQFRQTILNLAVRGKLVPQDSRNEYIAETYAREPSSDELPNNWRLLNFGKFCDIEGGNQPPKSQFISEPRKGYVRLLQIRDLGERPVPTFIPIGSTNRFCKEGEILIGRYGASVGKIFWAQDGAYNVAMAKFIWPDDALISSFTFLLLKSEYLQGPLASATRSAQAGFNKGDLAAINFPLPPLGEQHRIVAKIDELMALCDRLEASLTTADDTRRRLLEALLAKALAPDDKRELEAAE